MLGTMMTKSTHCNVDTREHLLATGETLSLRLGFTGMGPVSYTHLTLPTTPYV